MDSRERDAEGLTICPNCKRRYKPDLGERTKDVCIQDEFPNATKEQREQLVTGLCSGSCWNEYLGIGKRRNK
jgi:hypothetical protein